MIANRWQFTTIQIPWQRAKAIIEKEKWPSTLGTDPRYPEPRTTYQQYLGMVMRGESHEFCTPHGSKLLYRDRRWLIYGYAYDGSDMIPYI